MRVYAMILPESGTGGGGLRGQKGELAPGAVTDVTGAAWGNATSFPCPATNWADPAVMASVMAGNDGVGLNGWLKKNAGSAPVKWSYANLGEVGKIAYTVIADADVPADLANGFAFEDAKGVRYPIVRLADAGVDVGQVKKQAYLTAVMATLVASAAIYK